MPSHQIQSPVWSLRTGCWTLVPFWNCGYTLGWGGACGGREDDEDSWIRWAGRSSGAAVGGWEPAALPSILVCWGLGAGAPLFLRAPLGETGGGGSRGACGCNKGCVACWSGSRSGGSAGVCMVAFARFCVTSASFCMVSEGYVGHGSAGGLSSKWRWRW